MRLRAPIILGAIAVGLAGLFLLLRPAIEDRAARAIEARLRQETGAEWRLRGGAALGLLPMPRLVLRDLTVGSTETDPGAYGARIRQVTLTNPLALIGGADSVHAVAEGVSLRAPLGRDGKAQAPSGPLSLGRLAGLDLLVTGAKADLVDGRAVAASAETLDLTFRTAEAPAKTEIKASVELPETRATLALDLPRGSAGEPAAGPARLVLEPRGNGCRIEATARATLAPSRLTLDDLAGSIDRAPFSGSASLGLAGRPRIALDLGIEALTLTGERSPADAGAAAGVVVTVPPDVIPDMRWFEGYEARASFRFARLTLGSVRLERVGVTADVREGGLDLALTGASAYEGGARGRYVLAPDPDGSGRHQLSLSLTKVRVSPLLSDLIGVRGIDGRGSLRVDLQGKGTEPAALRRSAAGSADLSVRDGQIDGLDLAGAFGLIPGRGSGSLATRLDLLGGSFSIAEGQAVTNDLQLKTPLVEASGTGGIDLLGQSLDIRFRPRLVAQGARRQEGARLDVPVRVSGPWSQPSVSADLSGVARDPGGAIQTLQDLGERILGDQGGGLGGLLDSLLPKREDRAPGRGRSRSLAPGADEP